MKKTIFLNGKFVLEKDAKVSIFDFGYLYGDGVFETMRSYNGFIFKLEEHLTRLLLTTHRLFLPISYSQNTLKNFCYKILKKNNLKNASIRITITRGLGKGRFDPSSCKKSTISIFANDFTGYPTHLYSKGIPVTFLKNVNYLSGLKRPQIKSCNFQNKVLAKIEVSRQKLFEGLIPNNQGNLAEGITSNVFLVKKETLYTPSLSSGCLEGITRNTVLEMASKDLGLQTFETEIPPEEIYSSDECFLTNSLMELIPVVKLGRRLIGKGKPGPITQRLHEVYQNLVRNHLKEFKQKGRISKKGLN